MITGTYVPPTPTLTGWPSVPPELSVLKDQMVTDLAAHITEFDAVVCVNDPHGIALASVVAAALYKPLMIVCTHSHECRTSDIVCIGDTHPGMRFVYVDDFCAFGASWAVAREYFNQSATANVVAVYEAARRIFAPADTMTPPPLAGAGDVVRGNMWDEA
jgi:adenine/guanine phosphoribosyltransferase-like PRPP-binding protein